MNLNNPIEPEQAQISVMSLNGRKALKLEKLSLKEPELA